MLKIWDVTISHHKTAKDMWEALEAAHSGTKGVKARRVEMLVEEFHKFTKLPNEPIRDLELRFTHLINNLASLGKDIPEEEQVSKILKVLKGDWITKVLWLSMNQPCWPKELLKLLLKPKILLLLLPARKGMMMMMLRMMRKI